jgi:hypothetical protein
VLVAFGLLGWIMKQHGWARAPLILGFILGKLIEKYLFISVGRYQFEWLQRPGVIAIFAITVLVLASPLFTGLYRMWKSAPDGWRRDGPVPTAADISHGGAANSSPPQQVGRESRPALSVFNTLSIAGIVGACLWVVALLGFAAALWSATGWRFSARLMPQTAAAAGLLVIACASLAALVARLQGRPMLAAKTAYELTGAFGELAETTVYGRLFVEILWLSGLLAGVLLIGLMPAMGLYMFLYMATAGKSPWPIALLITVSLWIGFYLLFVKLLHVPWPPSFLGDTFPELREWTGRLI